MGEAGDGERGVDTLGTRKSETPDDLKVPPRLHDVTAHSAASAAVATVAADARCSLPRTTISNAVPRRSRRGGRSVDEPAAAGPERSSETRRERGGEGERRDGAQDRAERDEGAEDV